MKTDKKIEITYTFDRKSLCFWFYKTSARILKNRRKLMEKITKSRNIDPLIPENWYNISTKAMFAQEVLLRVEERV
jgi:hypothetical protein